MSKMTIDEMRSKQAEQRAAIRDVRKWIDIVLDCPDFDEFALVENREEFAAVLTSHSSTTVATPAIEDMDTEDVADLLWWMADRVVQLKRKIQKYEQAHQMTVGELIQQNRTLSKIVDKLADDEDLFGMHGQFSEDDD